MPDLLKLRESLPVPDKYECVEIYLPKKLKHLSPLYAFLKATLAPAVIERFGEVTLKGFSIYEVDGAFVGQDEPYEERTLVIRILFLYPGGAAELSVEDKIGDLGREIEKIAPTEEQIWICHYPQTVSVFRPAKRIAT